MYVRAQYAHYVLYTMYEVSSFQNINIKNYLSEPFAARKKVTILLASSGHMDVCRFVENCSVRIDKFGKKKLSINGFFGDPILGKEKSSILTIDFSTSSGGPMLRIIHKYELYVDKITSQKYKAIVKNENDVVLFLPEVEKIINFKGSDALCKHIFELSNRSSSCGSAGFKTKLQSPVKTMLTPQKKKGKENQDPNESRAVQSNRRESLLLSPELSPKKQLLRLKSARQTTIPFTSANSKTNMNNNTDADNTLSLSSQQQEVITRFLMQLCTNNNEENMNLFITGGAGTGKSFLLSELVTQLRARYGPEFVHLTATTGIAAANTGGITINQFSGINPQYVGGAVLDEKALLQSVCCATSVIRRWRDTKVLIIDEISMMSPVMFQALDVVGQHARGNKLPFGGLLVIACGDFFQLPPVQIQHSTMRTHTACSGSGAGGISSFRDVDRATSVPIPVSQSCSGDRVVSSAALPAILYCFQHPSWKQVFPSKQINTVVLETVFRQRDREFIDILERIRRGNTQDLVALNRRHYHLAKEMAGASGNCLNEVLPTKIFTHKREVDSVNSRELLKCSAGDETEGPSVEEHVYSALDSGDARYLQSYQSHFPVKARIKLCLGAQVMLMKNIDVSGGLVNGARGVIVRFVKETNSPVVKFSNGVTRTIHKEHFSVQLSGRIVASRMQYPLDLCWAVSVHKSQGMTVDRAELHLRNVFEYGQAYVALSRVRTRDGLTLLAPLVADNIKAHPAVLQFYEELERKESSVLK